MPPLLACMQRCTAHRSYAYAPACLFCCAAAACCSCCLARTPCTLGCPSEAVWQHPACSSTPGTQVLPGSAHLPPAAMASASACSPASHSGSRPGSSQPAAPSLIFHAQLPALPPALNCFPATPLLALAPPTASGAGQCAPCGLPGFFSLHHRTCNHFCFGVVLSASRCGIRWQVQGQGARASGAVSVLGAHWRRRLPVPAPLLHPAICCSL